MPLSQSRMKSQLAVTAERLRLLNKIKSLYTQKSSRLVFEQDGQRFNAKDCTNVALDFSLADDNIVFTRPTGPIVKSRLIVQDITYEAVEAGADGDDISVEYEDYTAAVASSAVIQDLTYTAQVPGVDGDDISIEYVTDGTAGAETVDVTGTEIVVHMDDTAVTGSTAAQIKAAIEAEQDADDLVSVAITGTGSDVQAIQAPTNLEDGAEAIGDAGNEVVTVVGDAILVTLQSGVSTATQVKAAIDAKAEAVALVTATISGTAGDAQVTAAADNLEDGSDVEQYDMADIFLVKRLRTKKYLIVLKDSADAEQAS